MGVLMEDSCGTHKQPNGKERSMKERRKEPEEPEASDIGSGQFPKGEDRRGTRKGKVMSAFRQGWEKQADPTEPGGRS